jgi:outer membrane lipoprotein-sorting protein
LKIVLSPLQKAAVLLLLPLGLSGCYKTTRIVQQTTAPDIVKDATVADLVAQLDGNFDAIKTLNASVTIAASTGGGRTGKVTDYTSFSGYILLRKPRDLRVILKVPVYGSVAMDMVSDGHDFKLVIPYQNKARVGTDEVKTPSKNSLENLRPGIFFDSILLEGVAPGEFVSVTNSDRTLPPEPRAPGVPKSETRTIRVEPDYDLAIMSRPAPTAPGATSGTDSSILQTKRVIHYSRVTLKPYKQDIYDAAGRIVTTVMYSNYQRYGAIDFPSEIDISRPFDEYALKITITRLTPNEPLDDEQFHLEIPPGMTIQKMD